MKHLGLFEGIGGFSLAARWMGWETVAVCEWNAFCQKVLAHHFPEAELFEDITQSDFTKYHGAIDIITGGFPCQPYSLAGNQKGTEDPRHLWPHMLRVIRQVAPRWVIGENVPGLVSWNDGLVFEQVQADLEACGYEVIPFNIPAAGVGAPHRRERIWFVAYNAAHTASMGRGGRWSEEASTERQNYLQQGFGNIKRLSTCGPTQNAHTDGWGSEQRQSEPDKWEQRNAGTRDNEQLPTNDVEARAIRYTNGGAVNGYGPQQEVHDGQQSINTIGDSETLSHPTNTGLENLQQTGQNGVSGLEDATHTNSGRRLQNNEEQQTEQSECGIPAWGHFPTQSPVCNGDDGLSTQLDFAALFEKTNPAKARKGNAFPRWRAESIKAGGNAIVPQVALQFYRAIQAFENEIKTAS